MPMTVQYGPISNALNLAAQAGGNEAFRWQFGAEQQANAGNRAAQELQLQSRAQDIQSALAQQNLGFEQTRFQAGQQQQAFENAMQQKAAQTGTSYNQQRLQLESRQADTAAKQAETGEQRANTYDTLVAAQAAAQTAAAAKTTATTPQSYLASPDFQANMKNYNEVQAQMATLEKELQAAQNPDLNAVIAKRAAGMDDATIKKQQQDTLNRLQQRYSMLQEQAQTIRQAHQTLSGQQAGQQPNAPMMPAPTRSQPIAPQVAGQAAAQISGQQASGMQQAPAADPKVQYLNQNFPHGGAPKRASDGTLYVFDAQQGTWKPQ